MIRTLTFAAMAALIAVPAAAQSIRISTLGKSPEQLDREILAAAREVCTETTRDSSLPLMMYSICYRAAVASGRAQLKGTSLAVKAPPKRLAAR